MDRIVPGVFAVKYYRRPNFDVHLSGVENEITGGQKLELAVSGQYFFGKPVNGGTVKTVLVGERDWQSIASRSTKLDSAGNAKFTMKIPRRIAGGDYRVVFSLRDESGRTATHTIPCQVNTNNESSSWSKLPQFLPVDQPLALSSNRDTIEVTRRDDGDEESRSIPVRKQVATIAFEKPGWYVIEDGIQRAVVYAYGKKHSLVRNPRGIQGLLEKGAEPEVLPSWVNLSDYEFEQDDYRGWPRRSSHDLWVLFDRRQVKVGDYSAPL